MTIHSEPFVLFHAEVGNHPIRILVVKEIEGLPLRNMGDERWVRSDGWCLMS